MLTLNPKPQTLQTRERGFMGLCGIRVLECRPVRVREYVALGFGFRGLGFRETLKLVCSTFTYVHVPNRLPHVRASSRRVTTVMS